MKIKGKNVQRQNDEIIARDKTSLDNHLWLKDKSLADLDNLPDPVYLIDRCTPLRNAKSVKSRMKKMIYIQAQVCQYYNHCEIIITNNRTTEPLQTGT